MSSIPKIGPLICHLLNLSMFLVGGLFLLVPLAIINVLSSNINVDDNADDKNEQTNVALLVTLTKMIGGIIIAYAMNTSVFLKNVDADFTYRRTLASQSMLGLIILLLGMLEDTNIDRHRSMLFVGVGSFVILMGLVGLMASFFPLHSSRNCDVVQSATAGGGASTAAGAGTNGNDTGADTRPDNTVPLLEGETEIEEQDIESSSAQNESNDDDNISDEPEFESRIKGTKRLIQLAGPHTFYLYAGCIALLIRLPFSLSIPHFVSETLGALARSNYAHAKLNIFLLFACGTVDAALDFWCVFLFGLTNLKMTRAVRIDTFRAILMQEMAFFDWTNTGDLASRLTSDCGNMGGDLTWFFRFSIESIVRIVSIVSYMLWRSPKLGTCAISVVPLVGAINKRYGDWLNHNAIAVQNALAQANSVSQEAFSCIRTVIAFASEDHELRKYKEKINNHYDLNVQQLYAQGFYYMVISTFLINTVVQALLLYVGMVLVRRGELQTEVLLAFMLYQGGLQNEVMNLFNSYTSLIKSSGAGDKVFDLLDRSIPPPGTGHESFNRGEDAAVARAGSSSNGMEMGIQVRQLSFSYPTRPDQKVLQGLDMDIPAGKTVALVGKSGCGKSTIIGLLQRFYDPQSGCILVNGLDLKDIHLKLHREKIGVVTQDPVLFSGSIRDNILYGKEDSSEHNVIDAAKLANAHEFILRFPDGYDTQVGERGMQLSGGQKQRIAIARAIISKPQLLLLDEATSALDTESEKLVQDALDHLLTSSNQMTTVVIAHRLQTVRNADNIVVLNEGCVLEQGSHGDLMKKNGIYSAMVKRAENGKLS